MLSGMTGPTADVREDAAQADDRAADLRDHNAALLDRHGAHRFAGRERREAEAQRSAVAGEREADHAPPGPPRDGDARRER
jgi:hypothetical protein